MCVIRHQLMRTETHLLGHACAIVTMQMEANLDGLAVKKVAKNQFFQRNFDRIFKNGGCRRGYG